MASSTSLKIQESVRPVTAPPPAPRPGRAKRWKWWAALALLAAVASAVWLLKAGRRAAPAVPGPPEFIAASRGKLVRSVRIGGTVAAVRFAGVAAPAMRGPGPGQLTIVDLAEAGAHVKKGDLLAEFDRQQQLNNFEDHQAEFISLTDQMAKRRAELDIEKEQRRTDLQKAIADLDAARLENRRNEVISRIDAEKNQQTLAEAEATLRMLRETQKLRDEAAESEMKLLEIKRERERLQMEHARVNYERMVVSSPIDGMVVLQPIWKGGNMGTVQKGDQVRSGMPFLQVVDSTQMLVRSRVSQLDAALLRPGGPVEIRLDAYPDLVLPGAVESVATLAQTTSWAGKVKVFTALFAMKGSDPRLIPDISASVEVLIEEVPDAVLVPRGAVVLQAGSRNAGFVWVKQGDQARARAVTLGPQNDIYWAVASGLKEGEQVAVMPPAAAGGPAGETPALHNGGRAAQGAGVEGPAARSRSGGAGAYNGRRPTAARPAARSHAS